MFSKLYLLPKNILLLSEKITVFQELLLVSSLFSRRRKHDFFLLICNTTIFFFAYNSSLYVLFMWKFLYCPWMNTIVCNSRLFIPSDFISAIKFLTLFVNYFDIRPMMLIYDYTIMQTTKVYKLRTFFVRKSHWIKWCSSEFIPLFINKAHIDDVAIFKNREYFCHRGVNWQKNAFYL